jgi:TIR domain
MNNPSDDHSELDFYISANRENAAAREVDQVLREAGYSFYFPGRNNEEAEADRIAANRSEAIVLILTKDNEQTQVDLDELLNILSISDAERRVIILQFEECEIASLLDRDFITNLVGLNSRDRALRILASAGQSAQKQLLRKAHGPLAADAMVARNESQPRFAPPDHYQEIPPPFAGAEADLQMPEESAAPDVAFSPSLREAARTIREARTYSHKEREKALDLWLTPVEPEHIQKLAVEGQWHDVEPDVSDPDGTGASAGRAPTEGEARGAWLGAGGELSPQTNSLGFEEETIRAQRPTLDELRERGLALPVRRKTPEEKDIIEFGVSHPVSVTIGVAFIVDALIYCQNDRERVAELAAELRVENDRFGFAGATEVVRGTKLNVTLELPWPTEPKIQSVYWSGLAANISFRVSPTNLPHAPIYGVWKIAVDGLTVGQVFFRLEANPSGVADERRFSAARAIKTAFASYTSKDRRRILARVQGIEKLGVNVFMDTHGLRSNEQYKKRIFEAIDSSDILYLFWSRHAQHSNWVEQEWRYGFRQKGLGFIDPVPLVDPRKAPPPAELAEHKHFNDWTLIYSEYEKSLSTWARIRSWLAD